MTRELSKLKSQVGGYWTQYHAVFPSNCAFYTTAKQQVSQSVLDIADYGIMFSP